MNRRPLNKSRALLALLASALAGACLAAPQAAASFGLHDFEVVFSDRGGEAVAQAGTHPYEMSTTFKANLEEIGEKVLPEEAIKDLAIFQPGGFVGDQTAAAPCETLDFLEISGADNSTDCADSAVVGVVRTEVSEGKLVEGKSGAIEQHSPIYFLRPAPGTVARLGFTVLGVPVTVPVGLNPEPPHNLIARPSNISQVLEFFGAQFTLWGVPADPEHDSLRGPCLNPVTGGSKGECPAGAQPVPFLTMPRACEGPLESRYEVFSWPRLDPEGGGFLPAGFDAGQTLSQEMTGCGSLGFAATTAATPSSERAESAAGLDFEIDVDDAGLKNPKDGARANADIAKVVTTLPAGMTANPSAAEGLGVCSKAQYDSATVTDPGCPGASKLGTIEATTPLLGEDRPLHGSLYLASSDDNPFGTLIALYLVIRDEELGLVITQAGRVDTDPNTGQIVTSFEDLPPFPLSHVSLQMRPGPRAPLITPPACGSYEVSTLLYPSSGKAPLKDVASFEIGSGPGGSPCPSGNLPFDPGFEAGTESNAAGAYSPFAMRLTRNDGDQDITRFDATLPSGVLAKLAGVEKCSDAAIAAAKAKTGRAELASPSCPESSKLGEVLTGAGVGTALTYVPGSLYMAGPVGTAPLSVVAVVPAVAGPFDVGTVVVRQALALDPVSAQAKVDSANSDPIPHILQGIPVKVRDIRVNVDRNQFTLNPTSCAEKQTAAQIFGGGSDFLSPADDSPVARDSRFQAASCASLGFRPRLAINLFGGTGRGAFPALRAIVRPPAGQANFSRAVVTLPKTAFLEQGHIRTICTRVQFAAGAGHGSQCPAGSVYGQAKAWSPLLDGPAQGPVYLRSSSHNLPDLVVALKGPDSAPVAVELAARIDSVKLGREGAGIRSTFAGIPDVPVSRFVLAMQGGKKGLIINSDDLCRKPARNRARANLTGQNGRRFNAKPVVRAVKCAKQKKRKKAKRARAGQRRSR